MYSRILWHLKSLILQINVLLININVKMYNFKLENILLKIFYSSYAMHIYGLQTITVSQPGTRMSS